jgi:plasmid stabilization system protein ParE
MGPRRRRIVWSEGAVRELDEATEYVAADSPQNAARLLERVLHAADSLADLSEPGRVLPELREPLVRELQVNPYRLIYSMGESEVVILAVLHQRRDFERWGRIEVEP